MYQYKVSDETSSQASKLFNTTSEKKNKSVEDFVNDLKSINTGLTTTSNIDIPESPTFERMENIDIDNEKIKQDSITELEDYRNSSINNINKEYENKGKELEKNKEDLYTTTSELKDSVKQSYATAKENANNDAIKRGLARSSIVINTLDAFNNKELETYTQIDKELTNNINAINFELNALVSSKEEALNNFDIEYASKLTEKINQSTEKLREAQENVIKYNNQIAEKEAEFNQSVAELENKINNSTWDKEKDYAEFISDYGINVVNRVKNDMLLNTAKAYFASLSKREAAEIVTKYPEIIELLGQDNYKEILNMYE